MGLLNLVQSAISGQKKEVTELVENKTFSFKEKITKEHYLILKDRCKAHSLSAKAIRQEAIKNKGNVRRMLRNLKSFAGQEARLAHVSLCFLRGKKYSQVEPNVEKNNKMKAEHLRKCLFWIVNCSYKKQLENDIRNFLES